MKHLLCLIAIIVVALTACDQGSEMMKPVIQEVMADDAPVVPTQEDASIYAQYDVNQDGKVDNVDLTLVSAALGQKQPTNPRLDVDGSGVVDASDIILVSKNYDDAAPGQEDAAVYAQYDVNQDGKVDNVDLTLISAALGQKQPTNPRLDVDGSGVVDASDIILVSKNYDDAAPSAEELTQEEMNAEEPTPEAGTGIADIFADINLPSEPTIPEGADVLDTDRVFHYTTETFLEQTQTWGGIVIEAGENPLENEGVLAFFQETKAWAEEFCGKPSYSSAPDLHIYSNSRAEREAFKDSLPGGWTKNPSDDDPWWYIHVENTLIVDSTDVYYTMLFNATDPCVFRN